MTYLYSNKPYSALYPFGFLQALHDAIHSDTSKHFSCLSYLETLDQTSVHLQNQRADILRISYYMMKKYI